MNKQHRIMTPMHERLHRFDTFQKDLNKLKFQVKMKRRMYDDEQYGDINERIKQCQGFVKRQKYQVMREEAEKVTCESDVRSDLYEEVKGKLQLSRKVRVKTDQVGKSKDLERFNINKKTEQSSLSEDKVIMEYQLTPATEKRYGIGMIHSRIKTMGDEKREHQRYVSEFQRKIKAELSKLPLYTQGTDYQNKVIQSSRMKRSSLQPKRFSQFKLPPIEDRPYQSKLNRKNTSKLNFSEIESNKFTKYYRLKERVNRSRSDLKNLQNREIDRICHDNMNKMEKSRVLRGLSNKFQDKSKYGDQDALDLMSKATLARANLLLEKQENFDG